MGKYVEAAQQRSRHTVRRLTTSCDAGRHSACPFTGAMNDDDDDEVRCVLDALASDPRVSTELAVNLVMALFRTGIDSVCFILPLHYELMSSSLLSVTLFSSSLYLTPESK